LRCICSEHTTASQYVRVLETDFWFEAHVALRCSGALHSTALQELRLERPGQDSSYEPAMGRVKLAIKPSLVLTSVPVALVIKREEKNRAGYTHTHTFDISNAPIITVWGARGPENSRTNKV
jgi:hypothetical protein